MSMNDRPLTFIEHLWKIEKLSKRIVEDYGSIDKNEIRSLRGALRDFKNSNTLCRACLAKIGPTGVLQEALREKESVIPPLMQKLLLALDHYYLPLIVADCATQVDDVRTLVPTKTMEILHTTLELIQVFPEQLLVLINYSFKQGNILHQLASIGCDDREFNSTLEALFQHPDPVRTQLIQAFFSDNKRSRVQNAPLPLHNALIANNFSFIKASGGLFKQSDTTAFKKFVDSFLSPAADQPFLLAALQASDAEIKVPALLSLLLTAAESQPQPLDEALFRAYPSGRNILHYLFAYGRSAEIKQFSRCITANDLSQQMLQTLLLSRENYESGRTPLYYVIQRGQDQRLPDGLRELLEMVTCQLDEQQIQALMSADKENKTPLHYATSYSMRYSERHNQTASLLIALLDRVTDIDIRHGIANELSTPDRSRRTPLSNLESWSACSTEETRAPLLQRLATTIVALGGPLAGSSVAVDSLGKGDCPSASHFDVPQQ